MTPEGGRLSLGTDVPPTPNSCTSGLVGDGGDGGLAADRRRRLEFACSLQPEEAEPASAVTGSIFTPTRPPPRHTNTHSHTAV